MDKESKNEKQETNLKLVRMRRPNLGIRLHLLNMLHTVVAHADIFGLALFM